MFCVQDIESEMCTVVISSAWLEKRGWEAVRDVYKRACIVHCPKRAVIRCAAFVSLYCQYHYSIYIFLAHIWHLSLLFSVIILSLDKDLYIYSTGTVPALF